MPTGQVRGYRAGVGRYMSSRLPSSQTATVATTVTLIIVACGL